MLMHGRGIILLNVLVWFCLVAMGRAPHTIAQERPNFLFAISDDQSYPYASAYGDRTVNTPAFDRIAREGVLFTNAFVASPGCSPSRAAILTGRYPWQLEHAGTHASSFSNKYVVYPDLLEASGYFVGYTGKGWGPGSFEDGGRSRNPAGPAYNERTLRKPAGGISNRDYAGNFADFLQARPAEKPFCFWYGGHEPHRVFEKGSGGRGGRSRDDVTVPPFLPDTPEIRADLLDYALETQWFDTHLGRMVDLLATAGQLDNTMIVVTGDNGMAFPRAKANVYDYGIHVPLAIRWPRRVPGGRVVDDLVSLTDTAPTFLEAAAVEHPGTFPMSGRSLMGVLTSTQAGSVDPNRTAVFAGRERHSSSRYNNWTYPQRCIRTRDHLLIWNFKPNRWPAGAPQKYEADGTLGPMHGAYHDIDACPTLTFLIENREDPDIARYFHLAVVKRPEIELFDIRSDPGCLVNLAGDPAQTATKQALHARLEAFLEQTGDPRVLGNGDIWETYRRYSRMRKFPPPRN